MSRMCIVRAVMFRILFTFLFFFLPFNFVFGAVVQESSQPTTSHTVDFVSGVTNDEFYQSFYRVNTLSNFDIVYIAVEDGQVPFRAAFYIFDDFGTPFETCNDISCINDDSLVEDIGLLTSVVISSNVHAFFLPSQYVLENSFEYLRIIVDPNAPDQIVTTRDTQNAFGYMVNGGNDEVQHQAPAIKICVLSCPNSDFTQLYVSDFDTTYQTRFTDLDLTAVNQPSDFSNVIFNLDWFIDINEIDLNNPNRYIQTIKIEYVKSTNSSVTGQSFDITPISDGDSAQSFTLVNLQDGQYDAVISFSNYKSVFDNSVQPFPRSNISITFSVLNGVITILVDPAFSDGTTLPNIAQRDCSLSDLSACIINPFMFLFVPSTQRISEIFDLFIDSDNPLIQNANNAFNEVVQFDDASPSGHSLTYNLEIPQANLDVEMFSIANLTYLMGDALPLFNAIMIMALYLGFIGMVITSVWSRFSPNDQVDLIAKEHYHENVRTSGIRGFNH